MIAKISVNNSLLFRDFNSTKIGFLLIGICTLIFAMVIAIVYKFFTFSSLLVLAANSYFQTFYRYNWYSVDLCNLYAFPLARKRQISNYLFSGLLEFKMIFPFAFLFCLAFYFVEMVPSFTFFFIGCAFIDDLLAIKLKRHKGLRVKSGIFTGLGGFIFTVFLPILRGDAAYTAFYRSLEGSISNHWVAVTFISLGFMLLSYWLAITQISKETEKHPFVNRDVIVGNIKYGHI